MMLLLGCVVMCEGKGPLIEKMKGMELLQQQALVAHIQQVLVITCTCSAMLLVLVFYVLVVVLHMVCLFCALLR